MNWKQAKKSVNRLENLNKTERKDNRQRKNKKNQLAIMKITKLSKKKPTTSAIRQKIKRAHTKIDSKNKN